MEPESLSPKSNIPTVGELPVDLVHNEEEIRMHLVEATLRFSVAC